MMLYIAAAISGIGAGAIYGTCVGNALKNGRVNPTLITVSFANDLRSLAETRKRTKGLYRWQVTRLSRAVAGFRTNTHLSSRCDR